MIGRLPLLFLLGALLGCDSIPRDPDGTLDRVRASRTFRVGMIASGDHRPGDGLERAFLDRVAAATGAQPVTVQGAAEPLLLELEDGRVDLVIGAVGSETPWKTEVAVLRPFGETESPPGFLLVPIARNGENAWIMLLEREARAVRAEQPGAVQ
jgi:hypothetical protein